VIWRKALNTCFLGCKSFGSIWYFVRHRLHIFSVNPSWLSDHLFQFDQLRGSSKSLQSSLHLIWCVWVIWKKKNNRIFQHKEESLQQLLGKIKLLSLWRLKAKKATFILRSIIGGLISYCIWDFLLSLLIWLVVFYLFRHCI
jgi:hypothetical protein